MKTQFKILFAFISFALLTIYSCKKSEEATPATNNNGTNNAAGFTPPTINYYKIDNTSNTPSADAFACSMSGGNVSCLKNFDSIGVAPANLRVEFPQASSSTPRAIQNDVAEGSYLEYTVDSVGTASNQVQVFLDFAYGGSYYYLRGKAGKVFVNKKNGVLRYTTDGNLTVYGPKYTGSGFAGYYSRQLKFSASCGAQF